MLTSHVTVEIAASPEEVWLQLVNLERYGLWSPSVMHVQIPSGATTLLSSPITFTLNTLNGRQVRKGLVAELSAPNWLVLQFHRAYAWWLQESWKMQLQVNEQGNTQVQITLEYTGWMKTSAYHHEHQLTKALLEAHLLALKEKIETLPSDDDWLDAMDIEE